MSDMELLTRNEAAKILRVSPATIYKFTKSNMIDHVRVGRRLLFPKQALVSFVEKRLVSTDNNSE